MTKLSPRKDRRDTGKKSVARLSRARVQPPEVRSESGRELRVVSWNINSVRLRLGLLGRLVRTLEPDVLCLQETKVEDHLFPRGEVAALGLPHMVIRGTKAYGGVAILSRLPLEPLDSHAWCGRADGRHAAVTLRLRDGNDLEIQNFYVPAGGDVPDPKTNDKFAHKLQFLEEMAAWFAARAGSRPLILTGDLNVAPLETDVWSHRQLLKVVSHTPGEVERLARLQKSHGFVDAVRHFIPETERLYSWWSYRARDWAKSDRGRRLDHVWVTGPLVPRLKSAEIFKQARGWTLPSDHVPVSVTLVIDH